jgi:hypothetical protein
MVQLIATIGLAVSAVVLVQALYRIWRRMGCIVRAHEPVQLKRIGKEAFVVGCKRCGWVFLQTYEQGKYCYKRYRGQFDDFEDYADEPEEAEPTFVEDDGSSIA